MTNSNLSASAIRRFLKEMVSRQSLAAVASSALVVTLIQVIGPVAFERYYKDVDQKVEAAEKAVDRIRSEADAFLVFATSFAVSITNEGKPNSEATAKLAANLLSQKFALQSARRYLPADATPTIEDYEIKLSAFSATLNKITSVQTMKEFWERASDLLVARRELYRVMDPLRA